MHKRTIRLAISAITLALVVSVPVDAAGQGRAGLRQRQQQQRERSPRASTPRARSAPREAAPRASAPRDSRSGAGLLRVILGPGAGLSRAILLRVLGLTAGVLASWVLASWVLAAAAAFVRSLILISDWTYRRTTHHSTIRHIRGRECRIMAVVDGGMSQTILSCIVAAAMCVSIFA